MRIERHNLLEANSYLPMASEAAYKKHHGIFPPPFCTPKMELERVIGYDLSRLDDIRNANAAGQIWFGRMDIVLLNEKHKCTCKDCGNEHTRNKQYAVYPGPNGTIAGDVHKLTEEDKAWAIEESKKCWESAMKYPEFFKAYYHGK